MDYWGVCTWGRYLIVGSHGRGAEVVVALHVVALEPLVSQASNIGTVFAKLWVTPWWSKWLVVVVIAFT